MDPVSYTHLIGTALGLLALFGGEMFLNLPFLAEPIGAVGIAFCHTIFNVCTTLVLLPFSRQLERLANKVISTEDKPSDFAFRSEERRVGKECRL